MGATTTHLMSFEEFAKLPEPASCRYELRHGELVQVPPPKLDHHLIQDRIAELLKPIARNSGHVSMEFAFRGLPEYEYRIADVAYVSRARLMQADPHGYFLGAPDLVIEVLSPSNTMSEILDKEQLCLENGASEFWVVDLDHRQVRISTADSITRYHSGQRIPLRLFGDATLTVDDIFEPLQQA